MVNNLATLHLMVGLPCSGKTTLARELEMRYAALRLTTDEWHIRLFGRDFGEDMDESDETKHIEALFRNTKYWRRNACH
jgi:predicted kinase